MERREPFLATGQRDERWPGEKGRAETGMAQETVQGAEQAREFDDPIDDAPGFDETESRVAIWGHPLHAMSVAFPVALTFCAFGADALYWWSGLERWAWAGLWASGTAFLFGLAAGRRERPSSSWCRASASARRPGPIS
jgi:hypothetical protein